MSYLIDQLTHTRRLPRDQKHNQQSDQVGDRQTEARSDDETKEQ
jgi:hypothetical protein